MWSQVNGNTFYLSDTIVVFWLEQRTSETRVMSSNPLRGNQPILLAKALHHQPSHFTTWNGPLIRKTLGEVNLLVQWLLWEEKYWVPCPDGIKLLSLCSVRFWTSLVRNCLKYPAMSTRTRSNGILAIDLASSLSLCWRGVENKTKQRKIFICYFIFIKQINFI